MKLITFTRKGGPQHIGAVLPNGETAVDFTAMATGEGWAQSMLNLIEAGAPGLERARNALEAAGSANTVALSDLELMAPLPIPAQIRDFSVFPGHIRRAPSGMARITARRTGNLAALETIQPLADIPPVYRQQPVYYITNRFNVVGPEADIIWPTYSKIMDFELEFAAVLGRKGRDISRQEALSHVFGYVIYNDFSARDTQNFEMQGMLGPAKGKSFDRSNAMGPWLVTTDEIPDPQNLKMSVRVNGELWAQGNSCDMLNGFADMIAYVSQCETLFPGEVFGSGTMGNGCGLEVDRFLQDGDLVCLEVEGLGRLCNRVVVATA